MKSELSIRDAVRKLNGKGKFTTISALVKSTSPENGIASVLIEEFDLEVEARLTAFEMSSYKSGMMVIPDNGSYVLLTRIENSDEFMISGFTKVKEIWLGGDQYSLVKGENLKDELEKVKLILQALIDVLTGPTITEPGSGSPSALQVALGAVLTGKQNMILTSILNTNVKHG